ncbi:Protein SMG7 [Leucoagaricus sp. SymC.cos]|nr:Protein SMG7 [Leucoagaricus sp. SymC.cos]
MYRTFRLTEARSALSELGILAESDEVAAANAQPANPEGGEPSHPSGQIPNGRNHYQFPPETPDTASLYPSASNRGSRLAIFSKALVCLGDIARYRELYNDSHGRPRAGHDSVTPAKRRNRRGQEIVPRARNYEKAQKCYDQARLLVPTEGNPWHQLAILSSYQKDTFLSVVHYYRALCVQQPYDTATDNLNVILTKALDAWKGRSRREREKMQDIETAPHVLADSLRERIIVLHALWRLGAERGVEKMDSISSKVDQLAHHDFNLLVSERNLLADVISQIIVLSEGAFYKHRMIRPKTDRRPPANTSVLLDWRIIRHIYDLHSTLLNIGKAELAVPPPSDVDVGEDSLALKITATFRRTLPGLRIASKWLRANNGSLMKDPEFIVFQEEEKAKGNQVTKEQPNKISGHSTRTIEFWTCYVEFISALAAAFPKTSLPALASPLDEDIDMRGFLPLKKLISKEDTNDGQGSPRSREKPHPNAEQLMRIHDLLEDAKLLAELPNSLIKIESDYFIMNPDTLEGALPPARGQYFIEQNGDDNAVDEVSPVEEDLVEEALRARDYGLLDQEFDDEEEQIVYLQPTLSPVLKPAQAQSPPSRAPAAPVIPAKPVTSPTALSPKSPNHPARHVIPPQQPLPVSNSSHKTTAEDLLKDVMLGLKANEAVAQSRFLPSIWSASSDEQSLKFAAGGSPPKSTYQSPRQFQSDLPQTWGSSFGTGASHIAQQAASTAFKSPQTYAQSPQPSPLASGLNNHYQHQRLPSLSSPTYQPYAGLGQTEIQDPLAYSRLAQAQQLPLARPAPMDAFIPATSSPPILNSSVFNNVIGNVPVTSAPGPFGSPLGTVPASPRYTPGGLSMSPLGHTREASFGQSHHSPHHSHPSRPPFPGQPFASMPQAW